MIILATSGYHFWTISDRLTMVPRLSFFHHFSSQTPFVPRIASGSTELGGTFKIHFLEQLSTLFRMVWVSLEIFTVSHWALLWEKKGKRAVEETINLRQISHKRNSDAHVRHVLFLDFYSVIIHGGTVAGWRKMTRIAMQKWERARAKPLFTPRVFMNDFAFSTTGYSIIPG